MTGPTPRLVVDLDRLEANIAGAAAHARSLGAVLRPHVKTHKCLEIARMQVDAGAVGITVATIGEAEVFAAAGFDDIFIAYPLWVEETRATRLRALAGEVDLAVGVDSTEGARALASAGRIRAVVEVDSGHHRSGVPAELAGDVAAAAADAGLEVLGAFTFPGHSYGPGMPGPAAAGEARALAVAAESMRSAGVPAQVLSGGSTPSLRLASGGPHTELRPGVYVFGDAQQWELGTMAPDQIALTAHATVVSHAGGRAVVDAGSKVLGADRAAWVTGFGRLLDHPAARIVQLSEHHAVVDLAGAPLPPLGSVLRVVPNHVCNAVNLVDELDAAGGRWSVAARGANG